MLWCDSMDMQYHDDNIRRKPMKCNGHIHVIEKGDTLYKLSKKYDVRLFDIMRLNPYVNVYNLQIGDEICIPTAPSRPEKTYIVNEGDTIQNVLDTFELDFETLARWNPTLKEVELPVGLMLSVPLIQPRFDDNDRNIIDD